MNLSMDSDEGVVSSNRYQINRVNTASRLMFWLIAKPSTWFFQNLHWSWYSCTGIASPNPNCSGFGSVSFGNKQKHYHWQLLHVNFSGHGAEIPKAHFGWHDGKEKSVHSTKLFGESRWRNSSIRIWPCKQLHSVVRCPKEKQEGHLPVNYAFRKKRETMILWKKK